jgi:hypothetical protein
MLLSGSSWVRPDGILFGAIDTLDGSDTVPISGPASLTVFVSLTGTLGLGPSGDIESTF